MKYLAHLNFNQAIKTNFSHKQASVLQLVYQWNFLWNKHTFFRALDLINQQKHFIAQDFISNNAFSYWWNFCLLSYELQTLDNSIIAKIKQLNLVTNNEISNNANLIWVELLNHNNVFDEAFTTNLITNVNFHYSYFLACSNSEKLANFLTGLFLEIFCCKLINYRLIVTKKYWKDLKYNYQYLTLQQAHLKMFEIRVFQNMLLLLEQLQLQGSNNVVRFINGHLK